MKLNEFTVTVSVRDTGIFSEDDLQAASREVEDRWDSLREVIEKYLVKIGSPIPVRVEVGFSQREL